MCKYLFVYGSLMEGFFNYDSYLKGKILERKIARTRGKLYHLVDKGYPAMIDGEDYVYGELILIKDFYKVLKQLDRLENFFGNNNNNNEYNRVVKNVEVLDDNTIRKAYVYMYNCKDIKRLIDKNIYIPYGNWKKYIKNINKNAV
ncbi:Uncharacterized conserved protein YtfP, gamma-glutamylcyclotransferase (GGCT)/AIG2-like family [Caloranaerobacter azorensis DSM 13643]|uniref:Uncharacterized conserved protein YtfP, gamma-glutamylcyclotransferase (GGCT)/AIG2-like family n=1 Tax=Caloranaerobacter azorensis DSM 13643 TaxID=1121264 RepID=A0A1M5WQH2_9FIRM|nr:gamma-glutamylcyclotransferase family protein [Caloranaerobacter azorensis]SHH89394.1 Uncharacterized conserved protein YtfP, gamma-glutamylcyclotransferase (GGCT)/AIG2-like family [Caloranaerobacter azorensis DSM 13643]